MPPLTIQQTFALAIQHHQAGRLSDAEELYRQILAQEPDHAETLHLLGVVAAQRGQLAVAADLVRQAVALKPDWPEAHYNLGRTLQDGEQLDEAVAAYRQAIALKPDYVAAHINLGIALKSLARLDEAIAAYHQAIALCTGNADAHYNLGLALQAEGQFDQAIAAYRQAIALRPDWPEAHRSLGHVLQLIAPPEQAIAEYREVLHLKPDDEFARYHLATLGSGEEFRAAPASYVRALFDAYAPTFDEHLVKELNYQTPEQLLAAVRAVDQRDDWNILDLGCGTGLCGAMFRPHAQRLVGVDLSPRMLARAAKRNIYDELIESDITTAMSSLPEQCDLLLACDVLVYVGDLADVFAAASTALLPGGLFAFSVEKHDGQGFRLRESGRFAHSIDYLRTLAGRHCFAEITAHTATLRQEGAAGIEGWIAIFGKPGSSP